MKNQEYVMGIDLGTTNSCVAIMLIGQTTVITNSLGTRTTPSVVAYTKLKDRLVGQLAKRQAITNPKNTIYSVKRFIGRSFSEVASEIKTVPYLVKKDNKGQVIIHIDNDNRDVTPQLVSAAILSKMKLTAEEYIGQTITKAVITVPAYFGDDQRTATKDAGRIAGLEVLRIINEPTAAALAYGTLNKHDAKIAVFDLGGGTFDISILDISDGVVLVLSTNGDTHLGGDDFDQVITNWIVLQFKQSDGIDISTDAMALQRIKDAALKSKILLSGTVSTNINLPFITADSNGPRHLSLDLTRAKFLQMTQHLILRCILPCKNAISDSKLSADKINLVILVGGSTRIPAVQDMVKKIFNKTELNRSVNPDLVVAIGAAIQGGILSGNSLVKDILLLDVTPLSLGIETMGLVFTKIIDRNTTIPTKKSQVFSTAADNQSAVNIHVLQGLRPMATDNKSLGRFDLVGIPPAPRGIPQILVTFDIDSNGIIHVKAVDKGTGKLQSIKIDRGGQLSLSEVLQMVKDALKYASEDAIKQEFIIAKNNLDSLIFQSLKMIQDNKDKVPNELYLNVHAKINLIKLKQADVKTTLEYNNLIKLLSLSVQQIGNHIYSQPQQELNNLHKNTLGSPIDALYLVVN